MPDQIVRTTEQPRPATAPVGRAPDLEPRSPERVKPMRFLNRFVNPFIRVLLRSPLHPLVSSSLILLTYTGRRSGQPHSLPVMYARDGERLIVIAGQPQRKRWWRNLRGGAQVEVRLRGHDRHGQGRLVLEQPEIEAGLSLYLARFPRAAKSFQIPSGADGRPSPQALSAAARTTVMIAIELVHEGEA